MGLGIASLALAKVDLAENGPDQDQQARCVKRIQHRLPIWLETPRVALNGDVLVAGRRLETLR